MAASSSEVTISIENIAAISEENSAAIEEVSASAEEINAQVGELNDAAQSLNNMASALQGSCQTVHLSKEAKKNHKKLTMQQLKKKPPDINQLKLKIRLMEIFLKKQDYGIRNRRGPGQYQLTENQIQTKNSGNKKTHGIKPELASV